MKAARIVVSSEGNLIVGSQTPRRLLEPGTVYDIVPQIMDEEVIIVRKVGRSCISKDTVEAKVRGLPMYACWGSGVEHLIACLGERNLLFMTEDEYLKYASPYLHHEI